MEQKKKEKKVTFSQEIDNSISGFALVITIKVVHSTNKVEVTVYLIFLRKKSMCSYRYTYM